MLHLSERAATGVLSAVEAERDAWREACREQSASMAAAHDALEDVAGMLAVRASEGMDVGDLMVRLSEASALLAGEVS